MGIIRGGRLRWPRWSTAGLAWTLWALGMLGLAAVTWLDRLLRQAGRPDLVLWTAGSAGGGAGHRQRADGWAGAGRPAPPPPGRLAAAGLRAVAGGRRGQRRLQRLRAAGPPRLAAWGRLGGRVRAARRHPDGRLPGAHPAAHPDRVAAVGALALVAPAHGGRAAGRPNTPRSSRTSPTPCATAACPPSRWSWR